MSAAPVPADGERSECAPSRAQAWLDEHESDLPGFEAEEIAALITAAGLRVRVVPYAGGWTPELRSDRVTLWLTEGGEVASVEAG